MKKIAKDYFNSNVLNASKDYENPEDIEDTENKEEFIVKDETQ